MSTLQSIVPLTPEDFVRCLQEAIAFCNAQSGECAGEYRTGVYIRATGILPQLFGPPGEVFTTRGAQYQQQINDICRQSGGQASHGKT